jgi:acetyltransferase-like isoleucine patch superfamily enzyme
MYNPVHWVAKIHWYFFRYLSILRALVQFGTKGWVSVTATIRNPENVDIGEKTLISRHTHIGARDPDGVMFGSNCTFHEFGYISGSVSIGDGVRIANKVSMHSDAHRTDPDEMIHEQGSKRGTIVIEDDVWIGTGARILEDVTIGEGAVIGAGSVVTEDVEPYAKVGGVPARQISERC